MQTALIGNPNTGKTSLFNTLTNSYEYVGNWSGVTVEKKIGVLSNQHGHLIDLPGVYSLQPLSRDESVVIHFLLHDDFSNILNIVDASQLERNLQLTLSLLEYGKPVTIGLNMVDVAKNRGIQVDTNKLSSLLGAIVEPIIARTGQGCKDLQEALLASSDSSNASPLIIDYGAAMEAAINKINSLLPEDLPFPKRWLALQVLEGNQSSIDYSADWIDQEVLRSIVDELRAELKAVSPAKWIFQVRKAWIRNVIKEVQIHEAPGKESGSAKIDKIVTNKWLGIPIFFLFMYIMFMFTFDWIGTPLSDALDAFLSGPVTNIILATLEAIHANQFIKDLLIQGIVAGVGGVLVFVPQIFILFLFISFLEDSGYMARAALVMDRLMERVGLNGKAFIPMIIGFGCNVPGVMAARTIEQPKERLLTILLTPLMSCSARLPVYALFAGAFFTKHQSIVVFSLYVLGIAVALLLASIFSKTILKNEASLFVVELPPYRIPHTKTLWRSTWEKGKGFVRKAGTFIFGGSVFIWLLSYAGPDGLNVPMDDSFLAMIGGIIAPLLAPLGFASWQAGASLLTGFLAKEVVVSTMNIIYHTPDTNTLQGLLADHYTALSSYSFMVFILLYVPCVATVAAIRNESGSKKWTLFSIGYALAIAYLLSFIIYQTGKLFITF
ncbi:ferrous iron transport protein B [Falsibacillus pallidus]|uniref:Ferrous iron transport protein B n=1 Tax=Falsibacillus pallidus TaxID=493781 RepID=A0A370GVN9_9BACI|nr:ferrous iron transport protein B [Falsibacillus pallidus]RDI47727.1 ferrous iron transport protein B [Falsibacillus pallidus]